MSEIILGIDPGFGRIGYGVIEQKGSDWQALTWGCVETDLKKDFTGRLKELHEKIIKLISLHHPTRMAVEQLFFFKNQKTIIQVAQARGAILLTAAGAGLPVDEFTPLQIKQAITGYGRADKGQMQKVITMFLGIKEKIKSDDAADALACALCAGRSLWVKKIK